MRQALISDHRGSMILQGDGELGFQPFDAIVDAGEFVIDKVKDAGGAIVDAGGWVVDKACAVAVDPKFQAAAGVTALIPSGFTQVGAAIAAGTSASCMIFKSPSLPAGQPSPAPAPNPLLLMAGSIKLQKAPLAPSLPAGSIAAFDPKRGGYRVAIPRGLSGFGAVPTFTEVGVQTEQPVGARLVSLDTFVKETGEAKPWFKNPLVLGGIGAGLLAVGVGGYFLMR